MSERESQPFVWRNCGDAKSVIVLRNLTLAPNPVPLPGTVTYGLVLEFKEDVGSEGEKISVRRPLLPLFSELFSRILSLSLFSSLSP